MAVGGESWKIGRQGIDLFKSSGIPLNKQSEILRAAFGQGYGETASRNISPEELSKAISSYKGGGLQSVYSAFGTSPPTSAYSPLAGGHVPIRQPSFVGDTAPAIAATTPLPQPTQPVTQPVTGPPTPAGAPGTAAPAAAPAAGQLPSQQNVNEQFQNVLKQMEQARQQAITKTEQRYAEVLGGGMQPGGAYGGPGYLDIARQGMETYGKALGGYGELAGAYGQRTQQLGGLLTGLGEAQRETMRQQFEQAKATKQQELLSRGLTSSTALDAAMRGLERDYQYNLRQLEDQLTRQKMEYMTGLTGEELQARAAVPQMQERMGGYQAALFGRPLETIEARRDVGPTMQEIAQFAGTAGIGMAGTPGYAGAVKGVQPITGIGGIGGAAGFAQGTLRQAPVTTTQPPQFPQVTQALQPGTRATYFGGRQPTVVGGGGMGGGRGGGGGGGMGGGGGGYGTMEPSTPFGLPPFTTVGYDPRTGRYTVNPPQTPEEMQKGKVPMETSLSGEDALRKAMQEAGEAASKSAGTPDWPAKMAELEKARQALAGYRMQQLQGPMTPGGGQEASTGGF